MNKNISLKILIVVLLVLNAALMLFIFTRAPEGPDGDKPRNTIIDRLGFDRAQTMLYDQLIKQHRKAIREKEEEIMAVKSELYALLPDASIEDAIVQKYISELGKKQEEIERIHYLHFLDIKAICSPEQQDRFKDLSKSINEIFRQIHPKPHTKIP